MTSTARKASPGLMASINGRYHRTALALYLAVVVGHWAEHLVQAYQIWILGWPRPEARGVLGMPFPWLVSSEWLHYGYAVVMLIGLFLLLPGFTGRSRAWWTVALALQFWHHIEHGLLLVQAHSSFRLPGSAEPTSLLQLIVPRVELHLFYNSVVFVPMVIAMYLHLRPNAEERAAARCSCVRPTDVPAWRGPVAATD
ncbi:hypothetical protein GA0070606_5678 [Micromonospora citrea]|uniref:Uncharacterized protein n=1 Tax=Micromonospora citrea TaxID=47855 RepID=A0A1C6VYV2_9ACTN|nr:hypothetical protein [Micromonospora citrea]SCL71304.1 hypothetical protein GA0070606_5678 [Micromonospora citrea]